MFEQTFKNIDDVLWKEAGCTTELDYVNNKLIPYLHGFKQKASSGIVVDSLNGSGSAQALL